MDKQKDITRLVTALYGCVNKYGIGRVVSKINELNEPSVDKKIRKYIINLVCETYNVSYAEITKPYIRNVDGKKIIEARNMCFLQVKNHLKYSHQDIANLFGKKSKGAVTNVIKEYENMEGKIKPEKEYLDNYKIIDEKINNFKTKIINN